MNRTDGARRRIKNGSKEDVKSLEKIASKIRSPSQRNSIQEAYLITYPQDDRQNERKSIKKLTVKNVYDAIGYWNIYYVRVMLLNSLAFGMYEAYMKTTSFLIRKKQDYIVVDCDGGTFDSFPNIQSKYMDDRTKLLDAMDYRSARDSIVLLGESIGYIYCLINNTVSRKSLVVTGTLISTVACFMTLLDQRWCYNVSISMYASGFTITYMGVMMHCMESLPDHLRPLGIYMLFFMEVFLTVFFSLILRFLPSWRLINLVIGCYYLAISILYFLFIPNGVITALTNKDIVVLQRILIHYSLDGSHYQINNQLKGSENIVETEMNVERLIDDTVYTGHVTLSMWETITDTFKIAPYRTKLFILFINMPLISLAMATLRSHIAESKNLGVFEGDLYVQFKYIIVYTFALFAVYRYGRRFSFALYGIFTIAGIVMMIWIIFSTYDVCSNTNHPESIHSYSKIAIFVATLGPAFGRFVSRLCFIEHIPFASRAVILPIVHFIMSFLLYGANQFFKQKILSQIYPQMSFIILFVISLIILPFNTKLDNSNHMAITMEDVPCYFTPPNRYPQKPIYTDANLDDLSDPTGKEDRPIQTSNAGSGG